MPKKEELFETINCNLCGSDNYRVIFEGELSGAEGGEIDKIAKSEYKSSSNVVSSDRIVRCNKCGLEYVNPRLNPRIILKGYSEGKDEIFVSQVKGRELTFNKCLKMIEKYSQVGRILDIGTAGASFLKVAKDRGWTVEGVEPNKWLCEWAAKNYGIKVRPGDIFNNKFPSNHFDVVTLWDVLEHVSDPSAVLKECSRILKKGGLLVVNYPDVDSAVARLMGKKWVFFLRVHIFYFTPRTISMILKKNGFKSFKFKKHFQTLGLGYILTRAQAYVKSLVVPFKKMSSFMGLDEMQVPYWMGQTLVLARKQ
jgi:2-polyprenyl-3-methyl-5-hydroxy-6-metoxy-1,4-benzoquinol methylase